MKIDVKQIKKIRKKISGWIFPLLIISLFLVVGVNLILKLNNQTFYFYNNRYDVVLSDSMSYKNPEYEDFLKGHDDQIQKNDLVISSKIDENTELNVYDIVLFNSPSFGTTMHRIVDIGYDGYKSTFTGMYKKDYHGNQVFYAKDPMFSWFLNSSFSFSNVEAVIYSSKPYPIVKEEQEYRFSAYESDVDVNVESTLQPEGYYKNVITYDKGKVDYTRFSVTRRTYHYDSYFAYIRLYGGDKEIILEPSIIEEGVEEQNYIFLPVTKYLIRGDASNTADGWFYREGLFSKVHTAIPFVGVFIHFITSPWGIAMVVLLALLPSVYYFLLKRKPKEK